MCGLSGILSEKPISSQVIEASVQSIKHRGYDDTLFFDAQHAQFLASGLSTAETAAKYGSISEAQPATAWFGFNRLSIVDLSANGMQPFFERGFVFMMNGEVYNHRTLKETHLTDVVFQSYSDSEVAFRLFLKFGNEFVHLLNGMFTITIFDTTTQTLKVWRDRIGIKPFYYTYHNGNFIFSSEIKGILTTQLISKAVDPTGLAYAMYLNTCPAPYTIYHHIKSLPAAHYLEFNKAAGTVVTHAYWHLEYNPSKAEIGFGEFEADMLSICNEYNSHEVEKAIMISGGIDSGTLAYFFGKVDPQMQSIHIYDADKCEYKFAQQNAENAGLRFEAFEIPTHPSANEIETFLNTEEEPNTAPEPALFLCEKARGMGLKIVFNALGPDEIFGGYDYFRKAKKIHRYRHLIKLIPEFGLPKKTGEKLSELKRFGIEALPFISRNKFSWTEIAQIFKANNLPLPVVHPIEFINRSIVEVYPKFEQLPVLKKVSYYEIYYYIGSHHTFRSDQPSMRHGIEMRFPFLEHTFVQKQFNQRNTFRGLQNQLKPKFRTYAADLLPIEVMTMKKRGFTMPLRNWINEHPNRTQSSSKNWYLAGLKRIFGSMKLG